MSIQGITEHDIADYLANTPGFFERHAELISTIELSSPHGQRAVSLQERQMELLRSKCKSLERTIMDMIRHGQENANATNKIHRWTRALMLTHDLCELPDVLLSELKHQFLIPQVGLRLWGADELFDVLPCTRFVSTDARNFASSLTHPYCGLNSGFEATSWLDENPPTAKSIAMVSLRTDASRSAFGMLVLGSPDPARYSSTMETDFLLNIGELASACLSRLLPTP